MAKLPHTVEKWTQADIDHAAAELLQQEAQRTALRTSITQQIMLFGGRSKSIRGTVYELFLSHAGVVKVFPYENET